MARLTDRIRRVLQKPGTIDIRPYERMVERVGARAEAVGKLSDDELRDAAATLRTGEAFTDNELVELLAVAREAAERAIGERPFDCQLVGALALMQGRVIEMATGEGKTLAGAIA
ncbi:MAG TPA: accessory Sec system translocase SecA2, partial [Kribbellaceae bacterium]